MIPSLAGPVAKWRILAIGILLVAGVIGVPVLAHAGLPPLTPITPIFPPWSSGGISSALPATIEGYLKDESDNPIANSTVSVWGVTGSSAIEAQSFGQSAVTDVNGRFVITDVIEGTYSMTVNDPNATPHDADFREETPWQEDNGPLPDTRHFVHGGSTTNVGDIVLKENGSVSGRAMSGATPVVGSQVVATVTDSDVIYTRWAETDVNGRFTIGNAPAGDWSMTYTGVGAYVPFDPEPVQQDSWTGAVTISDPEVFTVAEGDVITRPNHNFRLGQPVTSGGWETAYGSSYQIPGISVTATDTGTGNAYTWTTDDSGWGHVYLPPGSYTVGYSDPLGCYNDLTVGTITATSGGATASCQRQLSPAAGTYAVHGQISQAGSPGTYVDSWITASLIDPSSPSMGEFRRMPSNGTGANARYVMRLPANTGFVGNQVHLDFDDRMPGIAAGTGREQCPVHVTQTFNVTGSSDVLHDVSTPIGGRITGTVRDSVSGLPVVGVSVSAERKAYSAEIAGLAWANSFDPEAWGSWWTLTDGSGNYTIGGLPTDTDYKVVFNPDYNPGWPLNILYRGYFRKVWHNRPLSDDLNSSVTPVVTDHDPVWATTGLTHASVDDTIGPGGYVALHADGPEHPTGAVYCDVMYQVSDAWTEVDSGFTTGDTFHKDWKVLPTGHYRVDYSDYFGRGAGSWAFDLAAGQHQYTSVLVPAPISFLTASTDISGSFDGLLNGGMPEGGTGGALLNVTKLPALPPAAPPPPANFVSGGGIYNVALTGAIADGVWTLTLPYDPAVPADSVGNLRVRHIKTDNTAEILVPFAWNTTLHTLKVQTTSLSPFQVMYAKSQVGLSKPGVPKGLKRNKTFTVTGTISPKHTAGAKSVQLKIYKLNSKRRYKLLKTVWTKNYNYRGGTQYRVGVSLGKGSYRLYAYAPTDAWHTATTSAYKQIAIK